MHWASSPAGEACRWRGFFEIEFTKISSASFRRAGLSLPELSELSRPELRSIRTKKARQPTRPHSYVALFGGAGKLHPLLGKR
jgi:hypothetical protein